MSTYTHEYSNFPNALLTKHNYKDVTDAVAEDVNKVKQYIANGDYAAALQYINEDPSLKDYIFGAEAMNAIDEETRNVEIYAKNIQQQIFYNDPEEDVLVVCSQGDVWIA